MFWNFAWVSLYEPFCVCFSNAFVVSSWLVMWYYFFSHLNLLPNLYGLLLFLFDLVMGFTLSMCPVNY